MVGPKEISKYVQLREAIKKRDKVTARNLILNNANVNMPNARGASPLHWAIIKFEDLEIMTMLLDRGANIHATDHRRYKPLEVAIQKNNTEATLLLIRRGALNKENLNSSLLMAIEQNNNTIVEILIDNSMQYNQLVNLNISLHAAIRRGHLKIMKKIKPHCQFLNPSDKYISRYIVMKSGLKYKECIKLLLKWNFMVNPNSNHDQKFVYGAVENGHLEIFLQLLKLGINVNLVNPDTGLNLLKIACINKHHEIVENLLNHKACVNVTTRTDTQVVNNLSRYDYNVCKNRNLLTSNCHKKDFCNVTCLHIAVLNTDPLMTKLLLRYDAKIIDDPTFFNITCIAVRNNCEEIVRMFLDQGVDVNDVDSQGNTLLHFCINTNGNRRDSRYNIVKMLLQRGIALQIKTPGNPLIFEAVKNGHHKIAQLFLDYDADIQYISPEGDTLLHKAIEKEFDVEFIKTLLIHNSPVDVVNNNMLTPLLVACKTKSNVQLEIITLLLQYNANVKCYNDKLKTALHFTCKHKSTSTVNIIRLLLKHNANIEAVDARGRTPIFHACKANNDVAVKYLLDHHANANHTDLENLTPLYVAAKYCQHSSEVVKILLEYEVNVYCFDKQGNSIIHVIVMNRRAELIKSLARTQVNFNCINKEGNTPLHIAISIQSIDTTETLIKYGANVNIVDKKNRTPLQSAMKYNSDYQYEFENYLDRRDVDWNRGYFSDNSDNDDSDTDYYESDIDRCKDIIKILKMQVLKLKTAGLTVNKQNLKIVYNPDDYSDDEFFDYDAGNSIDPLQFEEECEQEIEKIRMESIGVNSMTLYDLLKKNIYILSRFVKNKKIQQKLDLEVYDKKFPLYMDIIRSRFRDAKLRYRLMNSAKKYFSLNVCSRLSDDCIDTVFSYLNLKEIKMFIRAMKSLNK